MKGLFVTCISLIMLAACHNKDQQKNADKIRNADTVSVNPVTAMVNLLGSYVGSFGDNKITLLITRASKDSVAGRSIVGGNDRPFTGTVTSSNGIYHVLVKEPGGDTHDGVFDFTVDASQPDIVKGSWTPGKPTATLMAKNYQLSRRSFEYKPNAGSYPMASTRLLKEEDVENLPKGDLEFMRNEIFARHGYCFNKKALRQEFETEDWYVPNTVDVTAQLTEIEKKNIAMIKRYEKYATEYGDDFGR